MNFYVDENVLIPQPDTEILVEEVLKSIKEYIEERNALNQTENSSEDNNIDNTIRILDLCTGSGAIAISIAKYLQENKENIQINKQNINQEKNKIQFEIYGTDISSEALEIAKKNARANNIEVHFILSDMFEEVKENIQEKFDIVVSNPPYIENLEIRDLPQDVQSEPHLALDGGKDGLDFYRIIAKEVYKYLKENGIILLEIGYSQKQSVTNLFEENNVYQRISCIKDLAGNDRVIKVNL